MEKVQKRSAILATIGLGLGIAANGYLYFKRHKMASFERKVVLITGSSRGLGLALAHEFARRGARVILCARDVETLRRAEMELKAIGAEVLAIPCDVGDRAQVESLIEQSIAQFGLIDILVNNAGVIMVGPEQNMAVQDLETCLQIMFWGTVYTTLAVLPHMRHVKQGQIVNITSIGGRISVPHLLPYCSAKFAAQGFSEGLHAELASEGIKVTTVLPGLMRTGSHLNALFKGQRAKEYTLFGTMATLPFTATSAQHAARQIVLATRSGATELVITPQARLLSLVHGLLPGTTTRLMGLATRTLPKSTDEEQQAQPGYKSRTPLADRLTKGGKKAVREYNQLPVNGHAPVLTDASRESAEDRSLVEEDNFPRLSKRPL